MLGRRGPGMEGVGPRPVRERRSGTFAAVTTLEPPATVHWARGISHTPVSSWVRTGAVVPPLLYTAVTLFAAWSARSTTKSTRAAPPAFAGTDRLLVASFW